MPLVLTEDQKARVRHHLGYVEVEYIQTFYLGVPAALPTQFAIEGALEKLLPSAAPKFNQLLCSLDKIEADVFKKVGDITDVESMGEIKINRAWLKEKWSVYLWAQKALANMLGIAPNPYDQRTFSQGVVNVQVR